MAIRTFNVNFILLKNITLLIELKVLFLDKLHLNVMELLIIS